VGYLAKFGCVAVIGVSLGSLLLSACGSMLTALNQVPHITSLNPSSTTAGGPTFDLTITGTGFGPDSVVKWNGSTRTTSFQSTTVLIGVIDATDIASPGSGQVTISNPGTAAPLVSNPVIFPIL